MNRCLSYFFFLTLFFTASNYASAQYTLIITSENLQQNKLNFATREEQQLQLSTLTQSLLNQNYRPIRITNDTINSSESILDAGKAFYFETVISDSILQIINVEHRELNEKSFSLQKTEAFTQKILIYFENHGRPFVMVRPHPEIINDSTIRISLTVDQGPEIRYDSIDIKGNSRISNRFLKAYLGIKKGKLYRETEIQSVEKKLSKLSFLQSDKQPEIAFIEQKLRLILYLNKKNSSQFDGIVGLLPQSGENKKTLITGDVKLNLKNTFNQAEQIELNWRRSDPLSQDLLIGSVIPYLLGSNYGAQFNFKLIKKDTTTMTTTTKIGGIYYLAGLNNLSVYFENSNSKLLSVSNIINTGILSQNIDYSINRYGLSTEIDLLNDLWIPTKGIKIGVDFNVGTRKVIVNSKVPAEYYDNIKKDETQLKATLNFESYYPLFRKIIFNVTNKTNYISGNNRYENELFRFGGLNSLRGFNEESLMASFVSIINTELRWLMDRRTYLFVFWNGAYYEKRTITKFVHDTPFGTGVGLSFDTPAGIFNITYALGKEFNNPIQLKYGKIHFGIVARF